MRNKKFATMKQWNEIGDASKQARIQLMQLGDLVSGKASKKYRDRLIRIIARLDALRSDLEEEMFKQHPDEGHVHVFYGECESTTEIKNVHNETYNRHNQRRVQTIFK